MNMEIIPHPAGPALPALIAGQGTCAGPKETYSPCDRKCRFIPCPPDQSKRTSQTAVRKREWSPESCLRFTFRENPTLRQLAIGLGVLLCAESHYMRLAFPGVIYNPQAGEVHASRLT